MESGNLVFLYDDKSVVDVPYPEFWYDYSKYRPLRPLQDGFGNEPRYRGALLVVAVAKFEL